MRSQSKATGFISRCRLLGSQVPGILTAGTFYEQGGVVFYDVHDPDRTIVLELNHARRARNTRQANDGRRHATEPLADDTAPQLPVQAWDRAMVAQSTAYCSSPSAKYASRLNSRSYTRDDRLRTSTASQCSVILRQSVIGLKRAGYTRMSGHVVFYGSAERRGGRRRARARVLKRHDRARAESGKRRGGSQQRFCVGPGSVEIDRRARRQAAAHAAGPPAASQTDATRNRRHGRRGGTPAQAERRAAAKKKKGQDHERGGGRKQNTGRGEISTRR